MEIRDGQSGSLAIFIWVLLRENSIYNNQLSLNNLIGMKSQGETLLKQHHSFRKSVSTKEGDSALLAGNSLLKFFRDQLMSLLFPNMTDSKLEEGK
ncbi:MAG: hypothetical protein KQH63_11220 [Desulfobulbaceae bacterium]|nr:hypothetical protein [Desulfobulbaceae bacterium]